MRSTQTPHINSPHTILPTTIRQHITPSTRYLLHPRAYFLLIMYSLLTHSLANPPNSPPVSDERASAATPPHPPHQSPPTSPSDTLPHQSIQQETQLLASLLSIPLGELDIASIPLALTDLAEYAALEGIPSPPMPLVDYHRLKSIRASWQNPYQIKDIPTTIPITQSFNQYQQLQKYARYDSKQHKFEDSWSTIQEKLQKLLSCFQPIVHMLSVIQFQHFPVMLLTNIEEVLLNFLGVGQQQLRTLRNNIEQDSQAYINMPVQRSSPATPEKSLASKRPQSIQSVMEQFYQAKSAQEFNWDSFDRSLDELFSTPASPQTQPQPILSSNMLKAQQFQTVLTELKDSISKITTLIQHKNPSKTGPHSYSRPPSLTQESSAPELASMDPVNFMSLFFSFFSFHEAGLGLLSVYFFGDLIKHRKYLYYGLKKSISLPQASPPTPLEQAYRYFSKQIFSEQKRKTAQGRVLEYFVTARDWFSIVQKAMELKRQKDELEQETHTPAQRERQRLILQAMYPAFSDRLEQRKLQRVEEMTRHIRVLNRVLMDTFSKLQYKIGFKPHTSYEVMAYSPEDVYCAVYQIQAGHAYASMTAAWAHFMADLLGQASTRSIDLPTLRLMSQSALEVAEAAKVYSAHSLRIFEVKLPTLETPEVQQYLLL